MAMRGILRGRGSICEMGGGGVEVMGFKPISRINLVEERWDERKAELEI